MCTIVIINKYDRLNVEADGYVRAYTFDFCSFVSVVYTTLNKLLAVFFIYYLQR